eukprot:scaffold63695_cov35-Attheya_sp.AAC.1
MEQLLFLIRRGGRGRPKGFECHGLVQYVLGVTNGTPKRTDGIVQAGGCPMYQRFRIQCQLINDIQLFFAWLVRF